MPMVKELDGAGSTGYKKVMRPIGGTRGKRERWSTHPYGIIIGMNQY